MAAGLRDRHGVGDGDRVAICAANCPEWLLTFWAVASLDAVLVAMNGWWTGTEMRNALELTCPTLVIMDEKRRARLEEIRAYRASSWNAICRPLPPTAWSRCRTHRLPRTTRSC